MSCFKGKDQSMQVVDDVKRTFIPASQLHNIRSVYQVPEGTKVIRLVIEVKSAFKMEK